MQLCEHDIFISDERLDKATALHRVVEKLSAAGNTTTDYLRGMLDREAQISTYLEMESRSHTVRQSLAMRYYKPV